VIALLGSFLLTGDAHQPICPPCFTPVSASSGARETNSALLIQSSPGKRENCHKGIPHLSKFGVQCFVSTEA